MTFRAFWHQMCKAPKHREGDYYTNGAQIYILIYLMYLYLYKVCTSTRVLNNLAHSTWFEHSHICMHHTKQTRRNVKRSNPPQE